MLKKMWAELSKSDQEFYGMVALFVGTGSFIILAFMLMDCLN